MTGSLRSVALSKIPKGAVPATSTPAHDTETTRWHPWGHREYYRTPSRRRVLYEATQRSFEPPKTLPQFCETNNRTLRPNSSTGATNGAAYTTIQDQLDELLNCIREGASKSASPGRGPFMVEDFSGNWVHIREAVLRARSEAKDIPLAWKDILTSFHAWRISRKKLEGKSQFPVPPRGTRSASDKTGRTTKSKTRVQQRDPRRKGSDRVKSPPQQSKFRRSSGAGLDIRQDGRGAGRPELRGDIKSKDVKKASPKSRSRGSARSQKPQKLDATTRASGPKLTIRDPFDEDAGVRQGVSAPRKLASKASHEKTLANSPDESQPQTQHRSRKTMRRPRVTTKRSQLWDALLNGAPEPEMSTHQREGSNARTPASGKTSARPRTKQYQKSSLGKTLADTGSPVSSGSGRSPTGSGSWKGKADTPRARTLSPGTRKSGKSMSSPLPPSDAELSSENAKKMRNSYEARRAKQARAAKPPAAWVLPRGAKEAASSQIRP